LRVQDKIFVSDAALRSAQYLLPVGYTL